MDPRLLRLYREELEHVREMGSEFSREFPKIAARLGMEGLEVADPYVERLLEGFAFVAARVRLKLDAEYPRFTQHLLQIIYPHYLSPMPAVCIGEFNLSAGASLGPEGLKIPRGSAFQSSMTRGTTTACEFRTTAAHTLWPIRIAAARHFSFAPDLPLGKFNSATPIRSGLRLKLQCSEETTFDKLQCDEFVIHFKGPDALALALHESVLAQPLGGMVVVDGVDTFQRVAAEQVEPMGFDDDQSVLPPGPRSFSGYRLLAEYFAFPKRFLFVRVRGLRRLFANVRHRECELVLLSGAQYAGLEATVDAEKFSLAAVPMVNLFPRRADRVPLDESAFEYQVVVDRSSPQDYEVFSVEEVKGFSRESIDPVEFAPFYANFDEFGHGRQEAFFTSRRQPTLLSERQRRVGTRSSYVGSEVFLSLVDRSEAPFARSIDQLAVEVHATNRDLPLLMQNAGVATLSCDIAGIAGATVISGPSRPRTTISEGDHAWRLLSHLSLNYLSLFDTEKGTSAGALQSLLRLYCGEGDQAALREIESIRSVSTQSIVRRLPLAGPIAFGRGLEIGLLLDESGFANSGAFLFGSVLERFFAQHVAINTFTQTVLRSETRGELKRWPARSGNRPIG